MRLVVLGASGAGKGTQCQHLSQDLGLPTISTGDILRTEIASGSELGQQVQQSVERGDLVDDAITIQLIQQRISHPDAETGWILDGYPRTANQAEELDIILKSLGQTLDRAIWLEVPEAVLVERSLGRGNIDDSPDAIQRRVNLFFERTVPMLDYYDFRQKLERINGDCPPEQVRDAIRTALKFIADTAPSIR